MSDEPRRGQPERHGKKGSTAEPRLLSYDEVAERLGTSPRFPRRLVAERRIEYVKLGRHVRIPEDALDRLIEASTVRAAE